MANNKCPDCNGELTQILVYGRGWQNPITGMGIDAGIGFYTDIDAERGAFTGMFKPKGGVVSFICGSCRRIFFYGADIQP